MKPFATLIFTLLSVFVFMISVSAQDRPKAPSGWEITGDNPGAYDFLLDTSTRHGGRASSSMRSKATAVEKKFGGFIQVDPICACEKLVTPGTVITGGVYYAIAARYLL